MTFVSPPAVVRVLTAGGWSDLAIQGPQGLQGYQGEVGVGVRILGSVPTWSDLDETAPGLVVGDGFITIDTGHFWVFDPGPPPVFNDVGNITGPPGPQGDQGPQGTGGQGPQGVQGAQGDQGAQSSVQGPQGHQGSDGNQGAQGGQGAQGAQGSQGGQGNQGAQGSQGAQGTQGTQGAQSAVQGPQGSAGSGFNWRGPWAASTAYAIGDVMTAGAVPMGNQGAYRAQTAHTSPAAVTNAPAGAQWQILAQRGAQGAQGNQGNQGFQGSAGTGAGGVGVPAGGANGSVLSKTAAADHAMAWVNLLPTGGATGTVLQKRSATLNDVEWAQNLGFSFGGAVGTPSVGSGGQARLDAFANGMATIRARHNPTNATGGIQNSVCGIYISFRMGINGVMHYGGFVGTLIGNGIGGSNTELRGYGSITPGDLRSPGLPSILLWGVEIFPAGVSDFYMRWEIMEQHNLDFFAIRRDGTVSVGGNTFPIDTIPTGPQAGIHGPVAFSIGGWMSRQSIPSTPPA